MGEVFGISQSTLLGLVVVAVGTSLPELAATISCNQKKQNSDVDCW
ncbi:MAG: hypothetical protein ACJ0FW_03630 [Gammaproteobacteria bacterium]